MPGRLERPRVYGDGPPGSQPSTTAPAARGEEARPRSRRRPPRRRRGSARRRGSGRARPRPAARPRADAAAARCASRRAGRRRAGPAADRSSSSSRAAAALARLFAARSPVQTIRRTSHAGRVGDGDVRQPDRLRRGCRRPARRSRSPTTASVAPKRARAPSAIARATCALTAPWAARAAAGTPSRSRFALVGVGHDAAEEVAAGARDRR